VLDGITIYPHCIFLCVLYSKNYENWLTVNEVIAVIKVDHNVLSKDWYDIQGGPKKTGPFLRVYKFATVGARNVCDMSKFSKFYLKKNIKLACQCV